LLLPEETVEVCIMRTRTWVTAVAIALAGAGCSKKADVEKVPVGSEVQVTRQDGGVVEGKLTAKDPDKISVDVGPVTRAVQRDQIADVRLVSHDKTVDNKPSEPAKLPPIAKFREYTVPAGTTLELELQSDLSSSTSKVEDPVEARLESPIRVNGVEVLPPGARVRGEVSEVEPAGKVKGRASLTMRFTRLALGDDVYQIYAPFSMTAPSTKKEDAEKIGIPAAGGAIVGAIIGGKKGAAIGGAVGGGAGTAVVLTTPGKDVALASGTRLSVRLGEAIEIKVPIEK
jgi:hypothetical protein